MLEIIKKDPVLKIIPVIVLTMSSSDEDILRSYNLSANCYITKPVDFHEFINAIVKMKMNDFWLKIVKLPK